MFKLLFTLRKYLPYILIAGVCIYFFHSYTTLTTNNKELKNEVRVTQTQLEEIQESYVKQQELIILQQKIAKDLEDFREESHKRTIDYLTMSKEIGNEIKNDSRSILHPSVVRMLDQYNSEHDNP